MSAAYAGELRALTAAVEQSSSELELSVLLGARITKRQSEKLYSEQLRRKRETGIVIAENVLAAVANRFHFHIEQIKGPSKPYNLVFARRVAMYLARKISGLSTTQLGRIFRRDHSSIVTSCQVLERRMVRDKNFARTIAEIEKAVSDA